MRCEQVESLLTPKVFGEMDEGQAGELGAHLEGCASCRRLIGDLRVTANLLHEGISAEPAPRLPDAKRAALFAAIEQETAAEQTPAPDAEAQPEPAATKDAPPEDAKPAPKRAIRLTRWIGVAAAVLLMGAGLVGIVARMFTPYYRTSYLVQGMGGGIDLAGGAELRERYASEEFEAFALEGAYRTTAELEYDMWGVNEDRAFKLSKANPDQSTARGQPFPSHGVKDGQSGEADERRREIMLGLINRDVATKNQLAGFTIDLNSDGIIDAEFEPDPATALLPRVDTIRRRISPVDKSGSMALADEDRPGDILDLMMKQDEKALSGGRFGVADAPIGYLGSPQSVDYFGKGPLHSVGAVIENFVSPSPESNPVVASADEGGRAGHGTFNGVPIWTTLVIPSGQSSATVTITPLDDAVALVEADETVTVTVAAGSGYKIDSEKKQGIMTIVDNDTPFVSVAASDAAGGSQPGDSGAFTITRLGGTSGDLAVNYIISGSASAIEGTDFTTLPGAIVTFSDGASSATIVDDAEDENGETVNLTIDRDPIAAIAGVKNPAGARQFKDWDGYGEVDESAGTKTFTFTETMELRTGGHVTRFPPVTFTVTGEDLDALVGGSEATLGLGGRDPVAAIAGVKSTAGAQPAGTKTYTTTTVARTGGTITPLTVTITDGGTATNGATYDLRQRNERVEEQSRIPSAGESVGGGWGRTGWIHVERWQAPPAGKDAAGKGKEQSRIASGEDPKVLGWLFENKAAPGDFAARATGGFRFVPTDGANSATTGKDPAKGEKKYIHSGGTYADEFLPDGDDVSDAWERALHANRGDDFSEENKGAYPARVYANNKDNRKWDTKKPSRRGERNREWADLQSKFSTDWIGDAASRHWAEEYEPKSDPADETKKGRYAITVWPEDAAKVGNVESQYSAEVFSRLRKPVPAEPGGSAATLLDSRRIDRVEYYYNPLTGGTATVLVGKPKSAGAGAAEEGRRQSGEGKEKTDLTRKVDALSIHEKNLETSSENLRINNMMTMDRWMNAETRARTTLRGDALKEWETSRKPVPAKLGGSASIAGRLKELDRGKPRSLENLEKNEEDWAKAWSDEITGGTSARWIAKREKALSGGRFGVADAPIGYLGSPQSVDYFGKGTLHSVDAGGAKLPEAFYDYRSRDVAVNRTVNPFRTRLGSSYASVGIGTAAPAVPKDVAEAFRGTGNPVGGERPEEDEAERLAAGVTLKIYDVADLTGAVTEFPGPEIMINTSRLRLKDTAPDKEPAAGVPAGAIAEGITREIAPESWAAELGTSVDERGGQLIVMQRPEVHARIEKGLARLRKRQRGDSRKEDSEGKLDRWMNAETRSQPLAGNLEDKDSELKRRHRQIDAMHKVILKQQQALKVGAGRETEAKAKPTSEAERVLEERALRVAASRKEAGTAARFYAQVGRKLYERFEYERARKVLKKSLEFDPNNREAQKFNRLTDDALGLRRAEIETAIRNLQGLKKVAIQDRLIELEEHFYRGKRLSEEAQRHAGDSSQSGLLLTERKLNEAEKRLTRAREIIKWMPYHVDLRDHEKRITKALRDVQARKKATQRKLAASGRSGRNVATRLKPMARQATSFGEKIEMMTAQTKLLFDKGKFADSENVSRQILDLDPGNLHVQIMIKRAAAKKQEAGERTTFTVSMPDMRASSIPFNDRIIYPKDWDRIVARADKDLGGAAKSGINPEAAARLKELAGRKSSEQRTNEREADSRYQAARRLFDDAHFESAAKEFDKALTLNPNHVYARKYLTKSRSLLGIRTDVVLDAMQQLSREKRVKIQELLVEMENSLTDGLGFYDRARAWQDGDEGKAKEALYTRRIENLRRASKQYDRVLEIVKWMPYNVDLSNTRRKTLDLKARAEADIEDTIEDLKNSQRLVAKSVAVKPATPALKPKPKPKIEKPEIPDGEQAPLPPPSSFKAGPVNPFVLTERDRFSTFAIDVDTASYSLARAYIGRGYRPPAASVRMEEFVNAFDYNYPRSTGRVFSLHAEGAPAPFGEGLALVKVGVRARVAGREGGGKGGRKRANLVFVVDTSGSMARPDRLPLVRHALGLLVGQLGRGDRVSLVTYGTQARLILDALPAAKRDEIVRTVGALQPGGSTNLLGGLKLGYDVAQRTFRPGEINRVLLLSDGVANIGATDADALLASVEAFKRQGITFMSVGFGMGAYNDALLEKLADKGDGSYVFVDSAAEARRVFVENLAATLQTVAKDAKIQVAFNPRRVRRYRLIGYENRAVADKDFRNDAIDAGEVGSGQSATALYEIELLARVRDADRPSANDIGTVYVRYQNVDTGQVEEIAQRLEEGLLKRRSPGAHPRFFLAACAAEFAEILRGSEHARGGRLEAVQGLLEQVAAALPLDTQVRELLELVQKARGLPAAH